MLQKAVSYFADRFSFVVFFLCLFTLSGLTGASEASITYFICFLLTVGRFVIV